MAGEHLPSTAFYHHIKSNRLNDAQSYQIPHCSKINMKQRLAFQGLIFLLGNNSFDYSLVSDVGDVGSLALAPLSFCPSVTSPGGTVQSTVCTEAGKGTLAAPQCDQVARRKESFLVPQAPLWGRD